MKTSFFKNPDPTGPGVSRIPLGPFVSKMEEGN
jgi:hypothetical protein